MPVQTAAPRFGKALHDATRPFAQESVTRSWVHVGSTFVLIIGLLVLAASAPWWPLRVVASVIGGVLMARGFILYHDYMHGAILSGSRLAKILFHTYGAIAMTPPQSWRESHNFHHANVGKIAGSSVGSFPLMTTDMWRNASRKQRAGYRIARHPVTILLAYVTIFVVNVTLLPLLRHPRRHWDSAVSIVVHGSLVAAIWLSLGFAGVFFGLILPVSIAAALGGYLFYAQHSFRGMRILPPDSWTYYDAALVSSSFMKMGPVMNWFTGNIGYHHIHHLNPQIPFYRLPEAMAAIPEVQNPSVTTLRPRDVVDCFRLSLWDPARDGMVGYRDVDAA